MLDGGVETSQMRGQRTSPGRHAGKKAGEDPAGKGNSLCLGGPRQVQEGVAGGRKRLSTEVCRQNWFLL